MGSKNKALRRAGSTPLHVYGLSAESLSLQAATDKVVKTLKTAGRTRLIAVKIDGVDKPEICLVRGIDVHPLTGRVLHVDFMRVGEKAITLEVAIELSNTATAPVAKRGAVSITQVLAKAQIKTAPKDIPQALIANCIKLEKITDTITVGDLEVPEGVTLLSDPKLRVVSVQLTRAARAAQQ